MDEIGQAEDPLGDRRVAVLGITPGEPGLAHGVGSVSYTHLRAHETVLDLVCRLLLEKKKHKDKQLTILSQKTNKHYTSQQYIHYYNLNQKN